VKNPFEENPRQPKDRSQGLQLGSGLGKYLKLEFSPKVRNHYFFFLRKGKDRRKLEILYIYSKMMSRKKFKEKTCSEIFHLTFLGNSLK
jgi:hypothetical protein